MRVDRAVLFRLATSERLERIVKAAPGGDAQAWRAASRYVAGRSRDEALIATFDLLAQGYGVTGSRGQHRPVRRACAGSGDRRSGY